MMAIAISLIAFIAIFSGALAGMQLSRHLPEEHLSAETRTAVSVTMAVIGTLAGLVMSLLLATENTSFRARADGLSDLATSVIKLDRVLSRLGPEAAPARAVLTDYARSKIQALTSRSDDDALDQQSLSVLERLDDIISQLSPKDDRGHHLQSRALTFVDAIADTRWLLVSKGSMALPSAFILLLILWLSLLFASFGLFAPKNRTVILINLLSALAIASGIFMILELGSPLAGLIRVPITPLQSALVEIDSNPESAHAR